MDASEEQEGIHSRLKQVLDRLIEQGTTQQAIAQAVGVPSQYVSDVKSGRKRVAELFARRFADGYKFDYRWLLTGEGNPPQFLNGTPQAPAPAPVRLPLFDHPIYGRPQTVPEWNGAMLELSAAAAAQAWAAKEPYIVRFAKNDTEGRLRQHDLVLVSQTVNVHAQIEVVRYRRQCFFARREPDGTFRRIATGQLLGPGAEAVGHCVGIVWGVL